MIRSSQTRDRRKVTVDSQAWQKRSTDAVDNDYVSSHVEIDLDSLNWLDSTRFTKMSRKIVVQNGVKHITLYSKLGGHWFYDEEQ